MDLGESMKLTTKFFFVKYKLQCSWNWPAIYCNTNGLIYFLHDVLFGHYYFIFLLFARRRFLKNLSQMAAEDLVDKQA